MFELKKYKKLFKKKKIFIVTTALIYSNGKLHLGHLMENIMADIWVKNLKLDKKKVFFIGGNDTHGTPIMIKSIINKRKINNVIKKLFKKNKIILNYFKISFDNFTHTNKNINKILTKSIFNNLKKKNLIIKKRIKSFYNKKNNIFLPDRFVYGICPYCYKEKQYSDNCQICKKNYKNTKLIKPETNISKIKLILKKTNHYFLKISHPKCYLYLKTLLKKTNNKKSKKKPENLIKNKIKNWDITRDYPYWGINIFKNYKKYFYVWFDALIGYYSNLKNLFKKKIFYKILNNKNNINKQFSFIGKDILFFHKIYLPIITKYNNINLSIKIISHGFICNKKEKLSKSKNIFFDLDKYKKLKINPDFLRYYMASIINKKKNIEFNLKNFVEKINKDLVGKYINIHSRIYFFFKNYLNKKTSNYFKKNIFYKKFFFKIKEIKKNYKKMNYNLVIKISIYFIKIINNYIEKKKPWNLRKLNLKNLHKSCSIVLESYKIITTILKPIIPKLSNSIEKSLNIKNLNWKNIKKLKKKKIKSYKHLIKKINLKNINLIKD